ncbi:acetyltransferase [Vibrio cholerae]|nr:acetyltransferase [Vibrio cholerae]
MVSVVVFEFSVMRCQPLRRALCEMGEFRCIGLVFSSLSFMLGY